MSADSAFFAQLGPRRFTFRLSDGYRAVLPPFIASRLMIWGAVGLSRLQVPAGPFRPRGGLLEVLSSGNAESYLKPADGGLSLAALISDPTKAFSPVFSLVLKLSHFLVGNVALAGVGIANLCLLIAGMLLYRLVQLEYPDNLRISRISVTLLMFSPASYFFTSVAPDSMALLLALAAALMAVRHQWLLASIYGVLLCATVNTGFWIIIPLGCEYLRQRRQPDARPVRPLGAQVLVLVPVAIVLLFGPSKLHDAWALLRVSPGAEITLGGLLRSSHYFDEYVKFYELLFRGTLVSAAILCTAAWVMNLKLSYWAFLLTLIAVCFWSHDLQAPRTLGLAFPLFIIMAVLSARFDTLYEVFLTSSMTLLLLCTIAAANRHWIG